MSPRFRTFTFVDRIDELTVGESARGTYVIPDAIDEFPTSLAAEAVGQLAAWSVMAALEFRLRPVAGIAGRIEFGDPPHAGETLELSGTIDHVDDHQVTYHGEARSGGRMIIRLFDCIGPMLPMEEFDDPEAVRAQYGRLRSGNAEAGGFAGIPDLPLTALPALNGEGARAEFTIPDDLVLFGDHFPRRHVLPGTILMHQNLRLADQVVESITPPRPGTHWKSVGMEGVKIRAFTPPGERIELTGRADEPEGNELVVTTDAKMNGRTIAGSRILFAARDRR